MDPAKLIDFLHLYPYWFRTLFAIWIVGGAGLAAGLVLLKEDQRRQTQPLEMAKPSIDAAASIPALAPTAPLIVQSSDPRSLSSSPEEYAIGLRTLSDRFLEKQEFIERHQSANVSWEGRVSRVSQHAQSKTLSLLIDAGSRESEISILVELPDSMRTKAFSLQRGDIVRVTGKLSLNTPSFPDLEATDMVLIRQRSGG
ncbi:MAG: hypothetical protein DCE87_11250 [Betaproteobacteria bacterium]|nr:MAG: hypothetical protein DCE87_11250 [Betaproteobacteria bacterium]PZO23616.1 MAG: hypothetical protein DCE89_09390 [Betaproteobacteria bacterium]